VLFEGGGSILPTEEGYFTQGETVIICVLPVRLWSSRHGNSRIDPEFFDVQNGNEVVSTTMSQPLSKNCAQDSRKEEVNFRAVAGCQPEPPH
jgi:Na+-transporting NADH:ubiquinone oxidoreductase subunit F